MAIGAVGVISVEIRVFNFKVVEFLAFDLFPFNLVAGISIIDVRSLCVLRTFQEDMNPLALVDHDWLHSEVILEQYIMCIELTPHSLCGIAQIHLVSVYETSGVPLRRFVADLPLELKVHIFLVIICKLSKSHKEYLLFGHKSDGILSEIVDSIATIFLVGSKSYISHGLLQCTLSLHEANLVSALNE